MLILGLLGMYFDAVVVEVKNFLLLFRLALAILCYRGSRKLFAFHAGVPGSNPGLGK
jgi:hypothetical protein